MEENKLDSISWIYWISFGLVSLIIFFSFYHALLYPETYWDSLIYYLHYGKMTWQQKGFPVMYCAQVGLALGANYPHIYHLICALFATLFGHYTDMYGQLLSPVAGLFATILIYKTGLLIFNDRTKSILLALLFRAIPFTNIYFTYATDYSFVLLYTAGFIYLALKYLQNYERFYLILLAIFTGTLPNINYLGWIFLPLFIGILFIGWKNSSRVLNSPILRFSGLPLLILFLIATPWYIRNWLVTGNPVYAFFPQIFGGKHINLEVLQSCFVEWTANGMGVPGNTLLERLKNSLDWFSRIWQVNPVLFAFTIPGILYLILFRSENENQKKIFQAGYLSLAIFFLGLFYHLFISNLYLYQIIFILPAMAILGMMVVSESLEQGSASKYIIIILVFITTVIPGLSMSIMGPKDPRPSLIAFRYPGLSKERFYEIRFPEESRLWEYINSNLHKTIILSHENRYHVFNDDITIRHLDDWDIQPLYNETDITKKAKALFDMGIRYYLFIPNERNHPIVAKLEIPKMIELGYLKSIYQSGDYQLYQFQPQLFQ